MRIDPEFDRRRPSGEGRAFVYVLPLRSEDLLKLGFSRDPIARMQALHPRYFDFFDASRACIVETDRVHEARRIETLLKQSMAEHRAAAPVEIPAQARGDSEWYRGACAASHAAVAALAEGGHIVHVGAVAWIREQLIARSSYLFEWSCQVFEQMELARAPVELLMRDALAARLRNRLDALTAFGIDSAHAVPVEVDRWYRSGAAAPAREAPVK